MGTAESLDDDARLRRFADELAAGLVADLAGWSRRVLVERGADPDDPRTDRAVERFRRGVVDEVRAVLVADVDAGRGSPLDVIRRGLGPLTELLAESGVPPAVRDEFEQRTFPDDLYGLAPASFADIDPALHDPGIAWGAARAHVHLRRRRASS
jgi:hypothetical protein